MNSASCTHLPPKQESERRTSAAADVEKGWVTRSGSRSLDDISWMMKSYKWMTGPLHLLLWRVILGNICC